MSSDMKGTRLALYALFSGGILIGFAPIFVRLSPVGPTATAFWRVSLSLPILALMAGGEKRNPQKPAPRVSVAAYTGMLLAGLLFAGDLALWHQSIRFTTVANATLLPNFAPVFVALGGWLFFGQRVGGSFLLGMSLAIAGTALLIGRNFSAGGQQWLGDVLGLVTAAFYGGYILAIARLRKRFSTASVMLWVGLSAALALVPVTLKMEGVHLPATLAGWLVLLGLALLSHVGGQGLIAYALKRLPAAFSAVSLLVQPVTAAVIAWLLFGEALSLWQAFGGVATLVGIFIARRATQV